MIFVWVTLVVLILSMISAWVSMFAFWCFLWVAIQIGSWMEKMDRDTVNFTVVFVIITFTFACVYGSLLESYGIVEFTK